MDVTSTLDRPQGIKATIYACDCPDDEWNRLGYPMPDNVLIRAGDVQVNRSRDITPKIAHEQSRPAATISFQQLATAPDCPEDK